MPKLIFFSCFLLLLNACSIQKCRYSSGFNVHLDFNKKEKLNDLHAEKAVKQKPFFVEKENMDTVLEGKHENRFFNSTRVELQNQNLPIFSLETKCFNNQAVLEVIKNQLKTTQPTEYKNTNGRVKTLRTLFAILGIVALILALVFIVFAIAELSYAWLLATTASASLSFVLLYIGKRKLDLGIIEIKKKWLKLLRDIAFVLMSITLAVWLVLKVFYG